MMVQRAFRTWVETNDRKHHVLAANDAGVDSRREIPRQSERRIVQVELPGKSRRNRGTHAAKICVRPHLASGEISTAVENVTATAQGAGYIFPVRGVFHS